MEGVRRFRLRCGTPDNGILEEIHLSDARQLLNLSEVRTGDSVDAHAIHAPAVLIVQANDLTALGERLGNVRGLLHLAA